MLACRSQELQLTGLDQAISIQGRCARGQHLLLFMLLQILTAAVGSC
jgi:hypothetical protein